MTSRKSKFYYIKTFGCYANEADSDLIAGVLEDLGFKELKRKPGNETSEIKYALKNSDVLIINSCSVRQKSEDKVYGLGKIIKDTEGIKAKVILTGCMVGSVSGDRRRFSEKELREKTKNYNAYFAPGDVDNFIEILKKFDLIGKNIEVDRKKIKRRQLDKHHAYVNISYGCDNFCSYCVVPYSRGREISRSEKEVIEEIKCLVNKGITDFTLCGQNVNSWGLSNEEKFRLRSGVKNGDKNLNSESLPFARLIKKVHSIKGVEKIDFISSNPFDFTQDLVNIFKLPNV